MEDMTVAERALHEMRALIRLMQEEAAKAQERKKKEQEQEEERKKEAELQAQQEAQKAAAQSAKEKAKRKGERTYWGYYSCTAVIFLVGQLVVVYWEKGETFTVKGQEVVANAPVLYTWQHLLVKAELH